MGLENQPGASHRGGSSWEISQSSTIGDKQGKSRHRSDDVGCVPGNIIKAVDFLSSDEREDVKKFGFGAFLNLKLEKPCKPQEAVHLLSVSELQKDHVAMKVLPDVTLNFRPDVVEKLLKVPRGTSKLPHFDFIAQKAEFKKLREQLGMEGSIEIKKLLKKLEELKEATEATDKALKLRIFFLIVISNYLIPKARNLASTEAVLYTSDMTKIADYDWCTIVYEHMRHVKETYKPGSQIAGCIIAWLVYFLDNLRTEAPNIDEDEDETENEDMDEIARINLYDEAVVKKMFKNIQFRDGMFVFRNLQLKDRRHTCYGESSTTEMSSIESRGVPAVQSAAARLDQPLNVQYLQGLLLEVQPYAPPEIKDKISAAMRQPVEDVEALYQKHVVSKMDSYDKSKTVIDINNITMTEEHFVKSFEPEGLLNSSAVDAQLSIWNAHYHDRIYLQQICAEELVKGGSIKQLSCQFTETKKKIEHVKLIFVPIFFKKHCFLVVANTETTSFDYMDSLSDPSYYEAALKVCENLRKYLCKHGIDALTWSLKIIPVVQQQNLHDCGYHMMLHMIHYGEKEMYNIVEAMVLRCHMEFAVDLLYNRANKKHPTNIMLLTTSRTGGSVNSGHEFSDDTIQSINYGEFQQEPKAKGRGRGTGGTGKESGDETNSAFHVDEPAHEESPKGGRGRGGNGKRASQQEPKAKGRGRGTGGTGKEFGDGTNSAFHMDGPAHEESPKRGRGRGGNSKKRASQQKPLKATHNGLGEGETLAMFVNRHKKAKTDDQSNKPEPPPQRPQRGERKNYNHIQNGFGVYDFR